MTRKDDRRLEIGVKLQCEAYFAWWFWPYFWGVIWTARLTGQEPDWQKFRRWATRAVRYKNITEIKTDRSNQ